MGPKLDFVREDVPNARPPTFFPLSVVPRRPSKSPTFSHVSVAHSASSSFTVHWHRSPTPPSSSLHPFFFFCLQFLLFFVLGFPPPRGRSTTSRRASTFRGAMHISPIFMEFLLDSFLSPLSVAPCDPPLSLAPFRFESSSLSLLPSPRSLPRCCFSHSVALTAFSVCHFSLSLLRSVYFSRPVAVARPPWGRILYGDFPINPVVLSIDQAEQYPGRRL